MSSVGKGIADAGIDSEPTSRLSECTFTVIKGI